MVLMRKFIVSTLLLMAAVPSWAMARRHSAPAAPGTEQKKSEFDTKPPVDHSPADKGTASGDAGSGSDTEAGPVGNDAAILGASEGTTSNMSGNRGDPGLPTGQSGAPADPGGGTR